MQQKIAATAASGAMLDPEEAQHRVLIFVERAQNLPDNADTYGVGIDPYVTARIVEGDPLKSTEPKMAERLHKERRRDRLSPVRSFAKSRCVPQNLNPHWEETLPVLVPQELRQKSAKELYLHLCLWDRDPLKPDDLVGQVSVNLATIRRDAALAEPKPWKWHPVPG